MKRLTKRIDGKAVFRECTGTCGTCDGTMCFDIGPMVDRLSDYEDTGLDPKQAMLISNVLREVGETYNCWFDYVVNCVLENSHLKDLAQAEKNGRLVMLPCKVGDTVYIVRDKKIIIATVEAIHQWISGKWKLNANTDKRYTHWVGYEVSIDDFGKTMFLTREEAEAALKKREVYNDAD